MSPVHGGLLAGRALKEAGVECVFTLCGGHIMPLYDGCIDEGIKIVDVRHEQAAVHAADAWAARGYRYRRLVTADARAEMGKSDVAVAEFFTGGQIRPNGDDVVVQYIPEPRVNEAFLVAASLLVWLARRERSVRGSRMADGRR